jgi:hypothetical protein
MPRQSYDWANYTPLDNTYDSYNVFNSAFKNIKFAVATSNTYLVGEHDMANLPGIAYKLFNDTSAWNIILRFNGLNDPIQDVYAGLVLNIPDKSDVIAYLSSQQQTIKPVVMSI